VPRTRRSNGLEMSRVAPFLARPWYPSLIDRPVF
jgi:hypothetical protein